MGHSTDTSTAGPTELERLAEKQALGEATNMGRPKPATQKTIAATCPGDATTTVSTATQRGQTATPAETREARETREKS
jgi:hypothetical protein